MAAGGAPSRPEGLERGLVQEAATRALCNALDGVVRVGDSAGLGGVEWGLAVRETERRDVCEVYFDVEKCRRGLHDVLDGASHHIVDETEGCVVVKGEEDAAWEMVVEDERHAIVAEAKEGKDVSHGSALFGLMRRVEWKLRNVVRERCKAAVEDAGDNVRRLWEIMQGGESAEAEGWSLWMTSAKEDRKGLGELMAKNGWRCCQEVIEGLGDGRAALLCWCTPRRDFVQRSILRGWEHVDMALLCTSFERMPGLYGRVRDGSVVESVRRLRDCRHRLCHGTPMSSEEVRTQISIMFRTLRCITSTLKANFPPESTTPTLQAALHSLTTLVEKDLNYEAFCKPLDETWERVARGLMVELDGQAEYREEARRERQEILSRLPPPPASSLSSTSLLFSLNLPHTTLPPLTPRGLQVTEDMWEARDSEGKKVVIAEMGREEAEGVVVEVTKVENLQVKRYETAVERFSLHECRTSNIFFLPHLVCFGVEPILEWEIRVGGAMSGKGKLEFKADWKECKALWCAKVLREIATEYCVHLTFSRRDLPMASGVQEVALDRNGTSLGAQTLLTNLEEKDLKPERRKVRAGLVEGIAGAGKTTLLRSMMYDWAKRQGVWGSDASGWWVGGVVVYLPLKHLGNGSVRTLGDLAFEEYGDDMMGRGVGEEVAKWACEEIATMLREGSGIGLFDALDEISEDLMEQRRVQRLWSEVCRLPHTIVTTRPGRREKYAPSTTFQLKGLTSSAQLSLLHIILDSGEPSVSVEEAHAKLSTVASLSSLACIPFLLEAIAWFLKQEDTTVESLNAPIHVLYDSLVDMVYRRFLSTVDRRRFSLAIPVIEDSEIAQLDSFLSSLARRVWQLSSFTGKEVTATLRHSTYHSPYSIDFLERILLRPGVLLNLTPTSDDPLSEKTTWSFAHRSLLEFFAAKTFFNNRHTEESHEEMVEELSKASPSSLVPRFFLGMASAEDERGENELLRKVLWRFLHPEKKAEKMSSVKDAFFVLWHTEVEAIPIQYLTFLQPCRMKDAPLLRAAIDDRSTAIKVLEECGKKEEWDWAFAVIDALEMDPLSTCKEESVLLHHATSPELVEVLLRRGDGINGKGIGRVPRPPLSCACKRGNLDVARALLDAGAHLEPSCLLCAVEGGSIECIDLLFEHGADFNDLRPLAKEVGVGLLSVAVNFPIVCNSEHDKEYLGYIENLESLPRETCERVGEFLVRKLLELGADPSERDRYGCIPLHYAGRNLVITKLLLSAAHDGCDVNVVDHFGRSALHHAAEEDRTEGGEVVQELLDAGADVTAVDSLNWTPLHHAALTQNLPAVQAILSRFPLPPPKEPSPTPLHLALATDLFTQHEKIVEELVAAGADCNAFVEGVPSMSMRITTTNFSFFYNLYSHAGWCPYQSGRPLKIRTGTPLHFAVTNFHEKSVETLLEAGADVSALDAEGNTPLHVATSTALPMLISAGAPLNVRNKRDQTVLHTAAINGCAKAFLPFLSDIGDIDAKDKDGNTALHLCVIHQSCEDERALLDAGATKDDRYWFIHLYNLTQKGAAGRVMEIVDEIGGETRDVAMRCSITFGEIDMMEKLLERGADLTSRQEGGRVRLSALATAFAALQRCYEETLTGDEDDLNGDSLENQKHKLCRLIFWLVFKYKEPLTQIRFFSDGLSPLVYFLPLLIFLLPRDFSTPAILTYLLQQMVLHYDHCHSTPLLDEPRIECIERLLELGADPSAVSPEIGGRSALAIAKMRGWTVLERKMSEKK